MPPKTKKSNKFQKLLKDQQKKSPSTKKREILQYLKNELKTKKIEDLLVNQILHNHELTNVEKIEKIMDVQDKYKQPKLPMINNRKKVVIDLSKDLEKLNLKY